MKRSKQEILTFLKDNREKIFSRFSINKLALFGSYARDEATENSDIDILVDMKPSFDNFFDLKYFLEDVFETTVDLGKEKNLRLLIKKQIENELIYV